MASWLSPSVRELCSKDHKFRPCISSEDSDEEGIICDNTVLLVVTKFETSVPCDTSLKADNDKILL